MTTPDPNAPGTTDHAARAAAQEAADARATHLLKRFGIVLLAVLAVWIAIVLYAFIG